MVQRRKVLVGLFACASSVFGGLRAARAGHHRRHAECVPYYPCMPLGNCAKPQPAGVGHTIEDVTSALVAIDVRVRSLSQLALVEPKSAQDRATQSRIDSELNTLFAFVGLPNPPRRTGKLTDALGLRVPAVLVRDPATDQPLVSSELLHIQTGLTKP
jgi:hypothetical protein